jgi:RHS repeat-associated protein
MRLTKRFFERCRSAQVFRKLLTLTLCYGFLLQPNVAFATRREAPSLSGPAPGSSFYSIIANETVLAASLSSLGAAVGKLGDFFSSALPTPPPPVQTITDAVVSRHKPVLTSGRIDGSLRVLEGESFTISTTPQLLGDLYLPGAPTIQLNTGAQHGGMVNDGGAATPANYTVTLNNNVVLPGHVHTRSNAVTLPADFPTSVPVATGTRSVTVRYQSDIAAIGSWQTVRDLNVVGAGLTINMPPGNYGTLTLNGNSQINFTAGVYNFANTFNLDGSATLQSTGLVTINVANDVTVNSGALTLGSYTAPANVHLNVLGVLLKINGSSQISGLVRAYNAAVTLNGTAQVRGQVIANSFTLAGGKVIGAVWPAQSGSNMTVFGPRRYDRTNGAPNQYVDQFSLPGGVTSPFSVHIQNGALDGSSRVSSATVKLNGIDILTPSDLNQNVAAVDRTVTLAANNQLDVRLASSPGSYLIINISGAIVVSDTTAPSVAITAPDNNSVTTDSEISVSGTASDTGTGATGVAHVYVNNVEAAYNSSNGTWSLTNVHLNSGANQIVARAVDQAGNEKTASITVTRQATTNHEPEVDAGLDKTVTLPATAALHGTATDDGNPAGSSLTITWTAISGAGDVTFTNAQALDTTASFSAAGTYVLRLTASDGALSSSDEVTITVEPENQPPTVDAGPNQTIALPRTAALNGTVTDDGLPTGGALSIAWSKLSGPGTVTFEDASKAETIATFSAPGVYVLRLFASDSALSSSSETTVTVQPENQAPVVAAGADQIIVLPGTAQLNGTLSDDGWPAGSSLTSQWTTVSGPAAVIIDSPSATVTIARFSAPGPYVLRLTASDSELSNFDDVSFNVTLPPDQTAPTLTITTPENNTTTQAATINVSGTVSDPGQYPSGVAQVTINDVAATINPADGTWTISVPLTVGNNSLVVRATDSAGNASPPQTIAVVRQPPTDTTAPILTISSPTDGSSTQSESITVSGTVSDPGEYPSGIAQVTVNGVPATIDGSNWSLANFSLVVGSSSLAVHAVDVAGNATDISISITREPPPDTTAPTLVVTSPSDGSSTQSESITVRGTVADPGQYASGVAQVTVNGVAATINPGSDWSLANVSLVVGNNSLAVHAIDHAGNATDTSISVTRQPPSDTTAPTLAITAPADGLTTQAVTISISGTVSDPGQYASGVAQVTVNDQPVTLNLQAGTWTISDVALNVGPNTITARATDVAGNSAVPRTITVNRISDTQSPTITITSPLNDAVTPDASITVTGTAIDEGAYATGVRQVLVNNQVATYDPSTHQWIATGVPLNEGPNTIRVFADDNAAAPNPAERSINVIRRTPDTQAPTVTISNPPEGFTTYDSSISVSVTAVDEGVSATGVQSVSVNGAPATFNSATGQWSAANVALTEGDNNILVTASDAGTPVNVGHANVHVTRLKIPPPSLTITNPTNTAVLAATSITVAGTVSSLGATPTVKINGADAVVSGGHFAMTVALIEGANTINVVATDSVPQDTQVSISVMRDTVSPAVAFANMPATVQPGGTYQVLVDASDNVGIKDVAFSVNGQQIATSDTSPYQFTLSVPAVYAGGTALVLSAVARDLTNATAVATAQTVVSGPSGISGYVFDDATGYPLSGVSAQLNSENSVVTEGAGTFSLVSTTPTGVVRLTKDGHTLVERLYSVAIGEGTALFDARLTPLDSQANLIPVAGGIATGDGGRLQVSFAAGSFSETTDERVTSVSPQGLSNLLPFGWSPLPGAIVDVRAASASAGSQVFSSPAHLTISPVAGLSSATPLTLAWYDEAAHRWIVVATGLFASGINAELTANLNRSGQYAFLVADTGSTAPPAPVAGQPLTAAQPADSAALDSAQASAAATPRTAAFSNAARSSISFFATSPTQLPSGVSIEATFGETYNLLGGRDSVLVDRPAQDFVLYAYPAATSDQPNRLGAFFIAKPTRTDFSITELFNANVHVEIRSGRTTRLGTLIDGNGGVVRASDGSQLSIPGNAVAAPQSVFFTDIAPEFANVSLPDGYEIVRAFDIDLGSATLNSSATISLPAASGDLSRIVVARLITVAGQRSPKVVARATADAGGTLNSTTATPPLPAGIQLSGIRTSGRYLFIRVPQPFGYVKGNVTDGATGNVSGMVKVSDDRTPFVDVTTADGQYVVIGSAGANALGVNQIGAVSLTTDATGNASTSLAAQDAVAITNVAVNSVPLQVDSITPAPNAQDMIATTPVTVTFNKPISASTITASSFSLSTTNGNPVLGNLTVLAGNRVAVFTPAATLAAATTYRVTLTSSIRDIYGHQLASQYNSVFTTADAVVVNNRLRPEQISISYPNASGSSTISIPAGSVPAGATLLVVNMTNGATVTTVAGSEAISLSIPASVGDEIILTIRQADGTEYTVTQSAYRRADGFVSVGSNGGTVTSEDGAIVLAIPSGAISGQANIKLTPKGEDSITLPRTGEMDPANVAFGAGVEIRSDGDFTLLKEVHLELPAPPGTPEGKRMAFMKPSRVSIDGQDTDVWETVTSGTVIGGKFRSSSPPFFGCTFATGIIIEIYAMMPTFGRVVFGSVKEGNMATGQPVEGVLCLVGDFSTGYFGRVTGRTNRQGTYALFEFSASTANAVPIKALHVATGRTAIGTAATTGTFEEDFFQGVSGFQLLRADLLLPAVGAPGGGEAPPIIEMYGRSNNLPLDQDSLYSRGIATVPQRVSIIARSNRALAQISGTVLIGGVETRQLTWSEEPAGSHSYQTPIDVSAEGSYHVKVTTTSQLGSPNSSTIATYNFVGLRNPNSRPPLPEPPSVIHVTPADKADNVDLGTDIRLEFSEPVRNLVPGSTVYVQEDGKPEQIGGQIISGSVVVQPDTPGISSIIFKPASSLPANKRYTVHVTTDVRDDTNDKLDQQYEGTGDASKQPFSSSFTTFGGMVVTPQPIPEVGTRIVVAGSYALAMQADQSARSRINIYDIDNPIAPTLKGSVYVPQRAFDLAATASEDDSIKVNGRVHTRLAAVVTYSPLHVEQWANVWFVNFDEPSAPEIVGVSSIFLPLDVPSTPLAVRLHQGRAYIGNVPYQGVNVVDVAQSIKLFGDALAAGKNPVVDAVRPETGSQFAGFGQKARVQTATLRKSNVLDGSGTAPSISVLSQFPAGVPVVYVANSTPKRLGALMFPPDLDGFNVSTEPNGDTVDPRFLSALQVNPADSDPRFVRTIPEITIAGGRRVPLAVLLSNSRLWLFDLTNPRTPIQFPSKTLAELGLAGSARWLEVEDNLAYVAVDNDIAVIDIADPANPRLISQLTGIGNHLSGLAVKDGFIYSLSPGSDALDGISVSIASPQSRVFAFGSSADASTICGNPIIVDRNTHKMRQSAGFYFQIFGHKLPVSQQVIIRKGEEIIGTVPATILPASNELVTLGQAEWRTDADIDRAATYTAEVVLDQEAPSEYHSNREVLPFSFLLENYNESMTLSTKSSSAEADEKSAYAFVLGTNANVTLTVNGSVVLNGPRSFGMHVEMLSFPGMAPGRYPFILRAEAQGDASISDQISGVFTVQREVENARPPGHTVVAGVDIASGNLGITEVDVPEIPNRGLSLSFTRSYNTAQSNKLGPIGFGWEHNFQVLLYSIPGTGSGGGPNSVTYRLKGSDGSGQSFKAQSLSGGLTMNAEKPYHGTLVRNGDGSFDYYTKARIRYHFAGAYAFNGFNFYDQSYMGNLAFMEEPDGNRLTLAYDTLGRMTSITDSSNRSLVFEYGIAPSPFAGVIATTNGSRSEQSCVPRGELNLLRNRFVKAQGGQAWHITTVTGPGGLKVIYGYDTDGNLTSVKRKGTDDISASTDDAIWQYEYKPTPNVQTSAELSHFIKTVTNPNGHATNYDYWFEQLGTPVKTVARPEGVNTNLSYTLDQNNRIKQATVTDARGNPTTYVLTVDGYTSSMTAPRGAVTTFDFNDSGQKTRETDPLGETSTFEYDAKGNLRKRTSTGSDGTTVSTEALYDQTYSKPLSNRDANGNVTSFTLDGHGKVTQVRLPNGSNKLFEYAQNGDLRRITDERGLVTQIQYDAYGNPAHIERETQTSKVNITDNTFDVRSRALTTTDSLQPGVTRTIDALDRVKTETTSDPTGFRDSVSTAYTYKLLGQVLTVTMSGGGQNRTESYTYDNLERMIQSDENGDGLSQSLTRTVVYDANSNPITTTDRRGVVTTNLYDELNYRTSSRLSGPFGPDITVETLTPDVMGNPVSRVDQYNATITFTYDGLHRLIKRTLPGGYFEEQTFDGNGNVTSTKDRNGRVTTMAYDSLNRPAQRRDPAGRVQTWTYTDLTGTVVTNWSPQNVTVTEQTDALDRPLSSVTRFASTQYTTTISYSGRTRTIVDPRNVTATEQLSAFGEVGVHEVQSDGQMVRSQMHYGAFGGLKSTTDANDHTTTFVLDALNRRISASYPGGFTGSCAYDGEGLLLSETNKRGVNSSMTYDNQGRERTLSVHGMDETIPVLSISYDDANRKETRTDANSHTSTYTYDGLHRLITLTNADNQFRSFEYDGVNLIKERSYKGQFTEYSYDSVNRQTLIKDPLNQVTVITNDDQGGYTKTVTDRRGNTLIEVYDSLNRLTNVTDSEGALVAYEYDGNNNRTAMVDGRGNRTRYTYDGLNRVKTINHADLQTETFGYDGVGNLTTYNDGRGPAVTMVYDPLDHLQKRINGAGDPTEYRYDGEGLLLEKTEPKGANYKTSYDYNALGSLKKVTDARNEIWQLTYDGNQNVKSMIDARNNPTTYDYDALDRLTAIHQPLSLTTTYAYDANGNRTFIRDPKGQEFNLTYDALDRLTVKDFQNTNGSQQNKFEFHYDPEANLTSVENTRKNGSQIDTRNWALNYDARNRLTSATDSFHKTVSYQYDAANNLSVFSDAAGRPTTYAYDANNRLQTATLTGSRQINYSWYADGLLQRVNYGAGLQREYTYDDADRVSQITNTITSAASSTQQEVFEYGYDRNSNRETETSKLNGITTRTAHYSYDQLNRLTQAAYDTPGGNPIANTLSYTYDAVGNRETETGTTATGAPVARSFVHDELNRLTQSTSNGTVSRYDYDENGNLLALKQNDGQLINSYQYDPWNQLRLVQSGAEQQEVARYDYDYARRRTSKVLGGSTAEQRFVYNSNAVVDEFDEQNNLLNRYDYGGGLVRGEFLGEGERFYFSDALGSTTSLSQMTQSGSSATARYEYDAWGSVTRSSGGSYSQVGYTGQRADAESALMPLGNGERYYSPNLGSFVQQDSFTGMTVMPQSLNRFSYAFNNPLRFVDRNGNDPNESWWSYIKNRASESLELWNDFALGIGDAFKSAGDSVAGMIQDPGGSAKGMWEGTKKWLTDIKDITLHPLETVSVLGDFMMENPKAFMRGLGKSGGDVLIMEATAKVTGPIMRPVMAPVKAIAARVVTEGATRLAETGAGRAVAGVVREGTTMMRASLEPLSQTFKAGLREAQEAVNPFNYRVNPNRMGMGLGSIERIARDAAKDVLEEGRPMSGPVEFRAPAGSTAEEIAQARAHVKGVNEALQAGELSPTGRVSTKGELRTDANVEAARERARAASEGVPYQGNAGHVPDTTWTGRAKPHSWQDLSPRLNKSLGAQARRYPIGYKPTEFIFVEPE